MRRATKDDDLSLNGQFIPTYLRLAFPLNEMRGCESCAKGKETAED
jgi:hypothetical protein